MKVDSKKCVGCGGCINICPAGAIKLVNLKAVIDPKKCIKCQACKSICPANAINDK